MVADYRGDWTDKAVKIRLRIPRKFLLDLIVHKPSEIRRRLAMKNSLVSTIIEKGNDSDKLLHPFLIFLKSRD